MRPAGKNWHTKTQIAASLIKTILAELMPIYSHSQCAYRHTIVPHSLL